MGGLAEFVLNEVVLIAASVVFIVTSVWLKRFPSYSLEDFKTLYILFVFLVVVKGLEKEGFVESLSRRMSKGKGLSWKLVLLSAFLSMFLTNDVALFVIVPITLAIDLKGKEFLVVLETLAVNGASAITPFGNPQNIFIYYHYDLSPLEFMKTILPFGVTSLAVILILSFFVNSGYSEKLSVIAFGEKSYVYVVFFAIFTLSVLRVLPLWAGLFPIVFAIAIDRKSLKIDYLLLLTFFVFFGTTDNLRRILNVTLNSPKEVFLYSSMGSQLISNVPSALFFADFTRDWKSLLWGVSVGGFGTLVSSMANLISYRLYRNSTGNSRGFLLKLQLYGFSLFAIETVLFFAIQKI